MQDKEKYPDSVLEDYEKDQDFAPDVTMEERRRRCILRYKQKLRDQKREERKKKRQAEREIQKAEKLKKKIKIKQEMKKMTPEERRVHDRLRKIVNIDDFDMDDQQQQGQNGEQKPKLRTSKIPANYWSHLGRKSPYHYINQSKAFRKTGQRDAREEIKLIEQELLREVHMPVVAFRFPGFSDPTTPFEQKGGGGVIVSKILDQQVENQLNERRQKKLQMKKEVEKEKKREAKLFEIEYERKRRKDERMKEKAKEEIETQLNQLDQQMKEGTEYLQTEEYKSQNQDLSQNLLQDQDLEQYQFNFSGDELNNAFNQSQSYSNIPLNPTSPFSISEQQFFKQVKQNIYQSKTLRPKTQQEMRQQDKDKEKDNKNERQLNDQGKMKGRAQSAKILVSDREQEKETDKIKVGKNKQFSEIVRTVNQLNKSDTEEDMIQHEYPIEGQFNTVAE
ncbi:MAG: hypothetical protein EZS28_003432 [Streblomastix strix]|uniref:Uncharacterized protein n=1 Tax=Streblomastix strix TaxID=222440 RepID=A0A5J4X3H9_9EUKA|nr:MAG: hypothetical protein EZS28_003432 [Streblomastix strix]